jgi:hypothetical protein
MSSHSAGKLAAAGSAGGTSKSPAAAHAANSMADKASLVPPHLRLSWEPSAFRQLRREPREELT